MQPQAYSRTARFGFKKYLHMVEHFTSEDWTIIRYVLLSPLLQYSLPNFSLFSFIVPGKF
jgi:hypothetical protein